MTRGRWGQITSATLSLPHSLTLTRPHSHSLSLSLSLAHILSFPTPSQKRRCTRTHTHTQAHLGLPLGVGAGSPPLSLAHTHARTHTYIYTHTHLLPSLPIDLSRSPFLTHTNTAGANLGPALLSRLGERDPVARGVAIGGNAHALGTASIAASVGPAPPSPHHFLATL